MPIPPSPPAMTRAAPKIDLQGDLRLRLEDDWNGQTAAGVTRPDRVRTRVRARLAATVDLGGGLRLLGRVRTAAPNSQQGANVTFADFDHNPTEHLRIFADRYSLAWQGKRGGFEAGRMVFPFFTQNEYFWDADIDPLGGAANISIPLGGKARVRLNGGAFALPSGLTHYSGHLYAGQAVVTAGRSTLAGGFFRFDADPADPDRLVQLDNDGARDYSVLAFNGQYRATAAGKPLTLGADLYRNLQTYRSAIDPISQAYRNQRTGYVLSAAWGDTAASRHVQIGYRHFHMEKLAVDASYSHDDAARLGTAAQAALTDLKGDDLFANYAISKQLVVGVRTILAQRISTVERGNRVRLDVVFSF
jgi:hypothetical protein